MATGQYIIALARCIETHLGRLKGKYDLVHVRLFLAVVQNYDPTPILRNLIDMLSQ